MSGAILECKCKVDIGALRSLMYRLLVTKPMTILDVTLVPDGTERLELPPETPWREAHKKLGKDRMTWRALPRTPEPPPEVDPSRLHGHRSAPTPRDRTP